MNQGLGGIGIKASGQGLASSRGQGAISFSLGTKNETFSMPSNTNTVAFTIWKVEEQDYKKAYEFAVTAGNDNEDFGNLAAIMMGLPRCGLQGEDLTSGNGCGFLCLC